VISIAHPQMLSGNLLSSRAQFSEIAIPHSLFAGADEVIEQFELFAAVHESVADPTETLVRRQNSHRPLQAC